MPLRTKKKASEPEVLESQIEQYAQILLGRNQPRTAIAEHITRYPDKSRLNLLQGRFYRGDGGYYVEEWNPINGLLLYTHFAEPWDRDIHGEPKGDHQPKWRTGMLRHHWMRFSIYDEDNLGPIHSVLKMYFGSIPPRM